MSRVQGDVACAAAMAAALGMDATLGRAWAVVALMVAVGMTLAIRSWPRTRGARLERRFASVGSALAFGAFAVLGLGAKLGPTPAVLIVGALALAKAAYERVRLSGAPLPVEGEPAGRVQFEGTLHAIKPPADGPAYGKFPIWLAWQWGRRWSSGALVELRDGKRRVWLDPTSAVSADDPELVTGKDGEKLAAKLAKASDLASIRMWHYLEGQNVFVVGHASLRDDPGSQMYREPGRIPVFAGRVVIGASAPQRVLRDIDRRLLVWSGVALGAGALMVLRSIGILR
jgi:hypothetical protein